MTANAGRSPRGAVRSIPARTQGSSQARLRSTRSAPGREPRGGRLDDVEQLAGQRVLPRAEHDADDRHPVPQGDRGRVVGRDVAQLLDGLRRGPVSSPHRVYSSGAYDAQAARGSEANRAQASSRSPRWKATTPLARSPRPAVRVAAQRLGQRRGRRPRPVGEPRRTCSSTAVPRSAPRSSRRPGAPDPAAGAAPPVPACRRWGRDRDRSGPGARRVRPSGDGLIFRRSTRAAPARRLAHGAGTRGRGLHLSPRAGSAVAGRGRSLLGRTHPRPLVQA